MVHLLVNKGSATIKNAVSKLSKQYLYPAVYENERFYVHFRTWCIILLLVS
jgi:hypothetical protein